MNGFAAGTRDIVTYILLAFAESEKDSIGHGDSINTKLKRLLKKQSDELFATFLHSISEEISKILLERIGELNTCADLKEHLYREPNDKNETLTLLLHINLDDITKIGRVGTEEYSLIHHFSLKDVLRDELDRLNELSLWDGQLKRYLTKEELGDRRGGDDPSSELFTPLDQWLGVVIRNSDQVVELAKKCWNDIATLRIALDITEKERGGEYLPSVIWDERWKRRYIRYDLITDDLDRIVPFLSESLLKKISWIFDNKEYFPFFFPK